MSARGHRRQIWQLAGSMASGRIQTIGEVVLPTQCLGFVFLFVEYGVNQLYVQIHNASLWQTQKHGNHHSHCFQGRSWMGLASRVPLNPLTCPLPHIVSCMISSVSV